MADPTTEDREGLAAEYVLRTLDRAETARAEALLKSDAAFAAEVARWESRLFPLLAAIPGQSPPEGALDVILSEIGRPVPIVPDVVRLQRKARTWKWAAGAATTIAASLIAFVIVRLGEPEQAPRYVAILESQDRTPAFVATADPARGGLTLLRVGREPARGRSFELWAIAQGRAPQSLGILAATEVIPTDRLRDRTGAAPLGTVLLAVTEETEGGSPTGQPTNAPIFTGKLLPAPPL